MQTRIIINDPPYGSERLYNGLRLAHALLRRECGVTVFLMGDAVAGAKRGQKTPDGFYNIERMIKRVTVTGRVLLAELAWMRGPLRMRKSWQVPSAALWMPWPRQPSRCSSSDRYTWRNRPSCLMGCGTMPKQVSIRKLYVSLIA
ncbi:DsrE/DsrF/TusD sulfur relay family protein [Nitrosomonas sp. ANs5]|uniref:DsrE/DsrF/TusD sulfur relay family protein n=1 Tax=Nitrosomonas sp. ANs5 TaxID=3423941 RepID=UPI003D358377